MFIHHRIDFPADVTGSFLVPQLLEQLLFRTGLLFAPAPRKKGFGTHPPAAGDPGGQLLRPGILCCQIGIQKQRQLQAVGPPAVHHFKMAPAKAFPVRLPLVRTSINAWLKR